MRNLNKIKILYLTFSRKYERDYIKKEKLAQNFYRKLT
ncbi:hypothetical protein NU08_2531 [Flavobacterium anhuiense]|uniref:Uncharacterized protein n=1 Tax=Flavobacterium anhuiense TaxID=459526 RepID=A0A444VYE6_9FLAO|nr:hypothetical protein NU08_2531 [Flavobacterium anhuiense]